MNPLSFLNILVLTFIAKEIPQNEMFFFCMFTLYVLLVALIL